MWQRQTLRLLTRRESCSAARPRRRFNYAGRSTPRYRRRRPPAPAYSEGCSRLTASQGSNRGALGGGTFSSVSGPCTRGATASLADVVTLTPLSWTGSAERRGAVAGRTAPRRAPGQRSADARYVQLPYPAGLWVTSARGRVNARAGIDRAAARPSQPQSRRSASVGGGVGRDIGDLRRPSGDDRGRRGESRCRTAAGRQRARRRRHRRQIRAPRAGAALRPDRQRTRPRAEHVDRPRRAGDGRAGRRPRARRRRPDRRVELHDERRAVRPDRPKLDRDRLDDDAARLRPRRAAARRQRARRRRLRRHRPARDRGDLQPADGNVDGRRRHDGDGTPGPGRRAAARRQSAGRRRQRRPTRSRAPSCSIPRRARSAAPGR